MKNPPADSGKWNVIRWDYDVFCLEWLETVTMLGCFIVWWIKILEDFFSGGSKGAHVPCSPWGSKFFQFHAVFGKIWQNHMLAPPKGWRPTSGKSWIRHCSWWKSDHFCTQNSERCNHNLKSFEFKYLLRRHWWLNLKILTNMHFRQCEAKPQHKFVRVQDFPEETPILGVATYYMKTKEIGPGVNVPSAPLDSPIVGCGGTRCTHPRFANGCVFYLANFSRNCIKMKCIPLNDIPLVWFQKFLCSKTLLLTEYTPGIFFYILVFHNKQFWQIWQIEKWTSTLCFCGRQLFNRDIMCGGGHAWQGACVAEGHGGGGMAGGACVAHMPPTPPPPPDTARYGQWAGGTHPTGMHTCFTNDYLDQHQITILFVIRWNKWK